MVQLASRWPSKDQRCGPGDRFLRMNTTVREGMARRQKFALLGRKLWNLQGDLPAIQRKREKEGWRGSRKHREVIFIVSLDRG